MPPGAWIFRFQTLRRSTDALMQQCRDVSPLQPRSTTAQVRTARFGARFALNATEPSFLTPIHRRHGVRLRGPTSDLGELLALERGVPSAAASLSELARSLGLTIHRPHHALGDALTTAQVLIALATHLDEFAPQTVRSLADARKRTRTFRMYPGGAG